MKKLKNAPLQEVIFEVKWELELDTSTSQLADSGFEFALGIFKKAVASDFPHSVRKVTLDLPYPLFNHKALFQFWKAPATWPVLQLGPGMLSVNDTEANYVWADTYYPNLKAAVEHLGTAYSKELNFIEYSLRYIDVVRVKDYEFKSWPEFIKKHINFSFENQFNAQGELAQFQFQQNFQLSEDSGLQVLLTNGVNEKNEPVFIWQTAVIGVKKIQSAELLSWAEKAHQITSDLFRDICKEPFYASFN